MPTQPVLNVVKTWPRLELDDSPTRTAGKYTIQSPKNEGDEPLVWSKGPEIDSTLWFKTHELDIETIQSLQGIQLFAETHDQGYATYDALGNWTWLELAIFEDDASHEPLKIDEVQLVWESHRNRFKRSDFGWRAGRIFDRSHDLLKFLQPGNVIGVRACARFGDWKLYGRDAYLIFDIGTEQKSLPDPPSYAEVISEINRVQDTLNEVNALNLQLADSNVVDASNAAFRPEIKVDVTRADAYASRSERPLRVLSLDGGGVRGLSSLMLLQEVLDKAAPGKQPWEVFDMIGGTSTGGLIAIMLGRLKMSIKDCIDEYNKLMGQVFPPTNEFIKNVKLVANGEYYDSSNLEKIIQDLIKRKLGNADASLLDESNPCKIFLMAVNEQAGNNRAPCFLRSYKNPNDMGDQTLVNIKLWQAARATSAAPAYFKRLEVDGYALVDGGLGANNPLGWLWTEVLGVFGPARATDCFLSIGTGIASNTKVERIGLPTPGMLKSYISVATNSEITHIMFRTLIDAFAPTARQKKYWRLNVSKPIPGEEKIVEEGYLWWKTEHLVKVLDDYESPGELDDVKALEKLKLWTLDFIKQEAKLIQDCVDAIRNNLIADAGK